MMRTVSDVSRMSWRGALLMAIAAFTIFYLAVPYFLNSIALTQPEGYLRPLMDSFITRRIHWVERLGLALTFACLLIAAWKRLTARSVSIDGQRAVGLLGRLLGRSLD